MRYFFIIHYSLFLFFLKACWIQVLEGLAINMQIHQTKKHKGFDIHVHVNKVF